MLLEFDELVKQRKELIKWMNLGNTLAKYGGKNYSLRVNVLNPAMIAYCGQQYAGDKNYYDAPAFFFDAVRKKMEEMAQKIVCQVFEEEIERLTEAINKHKENVLKELNQE